MSNYSKIARAVVFLALDAAVRIKRGKLAC